MRIPRAINARNPEKISWPATSGAVGVHPLEEPGPLPAHPRGTTPLRIDLDRAALVLALAAGI
jgi:hypothetical protein